MRDDVESVFFEGFLFVLFFADDDCHFGFGHPFEFAGEFEFFLFGFAGFEVVPEGGYVFVPVFSDEVVHFDGSYFVKADEHCFAGCPDLGVVFDEVFGYGVEAFFACQEVVFAFQVAFEAGSLFFVEVVLFDCVQEFVGDFRVLDAEFVGSVFVVERYCCAVFNCPFEVVDGDVVAEGSFGDFVVGQKRCSGKSDFGGGRQDVCHVFGKESVLGSVCFVGYDDDVVVRDDWGDVWVVEFLDEGEYVGGVCFEEFD